MPAVRSFGKSSVFFVITMIIGVGVCPARTDLSHESERMISPDGIHILDGSFVLDVGQLHVNITNHGLIGSLFGSDFPFNSSPSAQWPSGSGNEYLWGGGLWIGAPVDGQLAVTTGLYEREMRPGPNLTDTMYEARESKIERPHSSGLVTGKRLPFANADDDHDATYDEDWLNGIDDDGDGLVDEDFGQIGDQMFTCTMHDNIPLVQELYPSHLPIGLQVVQRTAAWSDDEHQDIIALDFSITNTGLDVRDDVYLGFFADFEIQRRQDSSQPDDMAGFFDGAVRGDNGAFYRIKMAYAFDGAEEDPLPGCIGLVTVRHTTEFLGDRGPRILNVNSFQIFSSHGQVSQGGEPLNDEDRYYLMSRNQHDPNSRPDKKGDMKVLISSGPFSNFKPNDTLDYKLAMVIGDGLSGALATASRAVQLARGNMFDFDQNYDTGQRGRETKVCLKDYPSAGHGESQLYHYRFEFMDEFCTGSEPRMGYYLISDEFMELDENMDLCIWVNADNCDECFRRYGQECTQANNYYWDPPYGIQTAGYYHTITGIFGREKQLCWIVPRQYPPASPNARVVPGDHQVEIFWDDISQYDQDLETGERDFESYRVWEATHWIRPPGVGPDQTPPHRQWDMIFEIDLINIVPGGMAFSPRDLPLGQNTGLEDFIYVPACLNDPRFDGLAEVMNEFVATDVNGFHKVRPPLRGHNGTIIPGRESMIPWESYPDVLDTFFAVTARITEPGSGGVDKLSTVYYHYLQTDLPNGFPMHVSVTATDHTTGLTEDDVVVPTGIGVGGEPANFAMATMAGPLGQTPEERVAMGNNIYVFPNPATREALAEFNMQSASHDDPTGVRIMFNNLPEANNTIRIFTVAGDLIQTIEHDGYSQGGLVSWNLMSRNGQEVVSGIYLYSVHSDRSGFDDFRGRFVVIR